MHNSTPTAFKKLSRLERCAANANENKTTRLFSFGFLFILYVLPKSNFII